MQSEDSYHFGTYLANQALYLLHQPCLFNLLKLEGILSVDRRKTFSV